ncbi:MAG: hypothetical protein F2799_06855 [Actinobacteria bacterium]|nr:hypothetical protein [Actinomycetota bacterium]
MAEAASAHVIRRLSTAALITVALGSAMVIQYPHWAQTSYFLLTKALSNGTTQIDADHWQTGDKSYIGGHFYSVKAPGMSAFLVAPYLALHAVNFEKASRSFANKDRRPLASSKPKKSGNGPTAPRTKAVSQQIKNDRLLIWALGLFGCVLPALLLLFMVRSDAERLVPGTGLPAALALGLGTMLLPFSTQLFGHVMGAFLLYGGFHLLLRERRGPPSLLLLLLAGLTVGFSVVAEYPMAFGGAVLGLYAMLRNEAITAGAIAVIRRACAYGGGVIMGLVPVAVYNQISFGSVSTMSYNGAVAVEGKSGHLKLGLNDAGFFGIGVPRPIAFIDILLSPRGLLSITPVCLLAFLGVLWMRRDGLKAEALAILGVIAIYIVYVSGYWLPFGGESPGPRFLVAILPFLALGLPYAWRRIPAATLVLAAVSATVMIVATVVGPLVSPHNIVNWWIRIGGDAGIATVFTAVGARSGVWSTLPVYLTFAISGLLGLYATRLPGLGSAKDLRIAACALSAWLLLALVVSPAIGEKKLVPGLPAQGMPWQLVILAGCVSVVALGLALLRAKSVSAGSATAEAGP